MNSFGNRNFMQPTGRLSTHPKSLVFFPFKFWVGEEGEDFFHFFLCSQHVPFKFPICSLGTQCVRQGRSQQHSPLIPYVLAKIPPLLTYIPGPKGEALQLPIKSSILGDCAQFQLFFVMSKSNWLIAKKKKKKKLDL